MADRKCILLEAERLKEFVSSVDTFIFDCDGVLYLANEPIPGVREVLEALRRLGKRILFATNNSTKSTDSCLQKFNKMRFQASKDEIYGTAFVAAYYLRNILKFPVNKKVYVLGMQSMADELDQMGIVNFGVGSDVQEENSNPQNVTDVELDPDVGAVLCGFDAQFSLPKMVKAASYLERDGCLFIATNCDIRFPTANKNLVFPGTGCQIVAIETAARRKPTVVGKPFKPMFECICARYDDIVPSRTCMVGDNLHTDILFGTNNGMKTLFVETGISTLHEVRELENLKDPQKQKLIPDFYLPSVADLRHCL